MKDYHPIEYQLRMQQLLKNVPGTAITLGTYGVTKRILDKYFPEDDVNALAPSTIVNIKPKEEQVDLF